MSLWHKHELWKKPDVEEDDEGDEVKSFEEQVLEKLASMAKTLEKLEKRIEALETTESTRIDRLEYDLRKKDDYVCNLLARLLDKDFTIAPIKAPTPTPVNKYSPTPGNGSKMAGPVGKLP